MFDDRGWLVSQADRQVAHLPSPNFNCRPDPTDISLLVIHNISLPPGQFGGDQVQRFFCNQLGADEHPYFATIDGLAVSSHFYIDRAGALWQFVSVFDRAWHAGKSCFDGRADCNDFSVGIELEGCDDQPFSDQQYQTLATVTHELMRQFPKLTANRITGHEDIAPGRKTDPGPCFDWQRYRSAFTPTLFNQ